MAVLCGARDAGQQKQYPKKPPERRMETETPSNSMIVHGGV
jgi:hypothetical protein